MKFTTKPFKYQYHDGDDVRYRDFDELDEDELKEIRQAYKDDFEDCEDTPEDKDIGTDDLKGYYLEHYGGLDFSIREPVRFVLDCEDEEYLPETLREVADMIDKGLTSGFCPTWNIERKD